MLKKIKVFFLDMLFAPSGAAFLVFAIMLLMSFFNFINTVVFYSGNGWMLLMIPISFAAPLYLFWMSRGGKKYFPTIHFSLPKKVHIPTIIFSTALLFLGSALIKILTLESKYTEFPLYNAFFAHRNGNIFNDIYLVLAFCILSPVLEGIVFRGILIKEHDKRGRLVSTVFSSVMFALLSFNVEELISRFFVGALLCIVLYATDSLTLTIAMHIAYNFFAVFFEPTLVSIKSVSSNYELFTFILAIASIVIAIFFCSHLARLYRKYSHDQFGENFTRSTPREKSFWNLIELFTSIPSIACLVLFVIVNLIIEI